MLLEYCFFRLIPNIFLKVSLLKRTKQIDNSVRNPEKAERKFPDFLKWKAAEILLRDSRHSEFISESVETTQPKLSFEKLHGLKEKPVLVRFRALSDDAPLSFGSLKLSEILLPLEDFALLPKSGELSSI